MKNKFGIYTKSYGLLIDTFKKFSKVKKVVLFGSRAMGNYKKGSDIDLAIFGNEIDLKLTAEIMELFNEDLPIPYFVDIVNFNAITNKELKKHIDNFGVVIYEKE